jgi:cyclopropane fatty-acyl-phospholipid synthase-like methyltransferase
MSLRGKIANFFQKIEILLDIDYIENVITKHRAQPWFVYALKDRKNRRHVWWPSLWLAARLKSSARILETGCGCGLNLMWFAQNGFRRLFGSDNDPLAIAAGQEICSKMKYPIQLYQDDGLNPKVNMHDPFDCIFALNWTYHVEEFDITTLIHMYSQNIAKGGYLAIDVIDESYNHYKNNEFLTSDWDKPLTERKPSEYLKRYSEDVVKKSAEKEGLKIVAIDKPPENSFVPRAIYIFQK